MIILLILCSNFSIHAMQHMATKIVVNVPYVSSQCAKSFFTHKKFPWPCSLSEFSKSQDYNELQKQIPLFDKQTQLFVIKELQKHKAVIRLNLEENEILKSKKDEALGKILGEFVWGGGGVYVGGLAGKLLIEGLTNASFLDVMFSCPWLWISCLITYGSFKLAPKYWFELDELRKKSIGRCSISTLKNEINQIENLEKELEKLD